MDKCKTGEFSQVLYLQMLSIPFMWISSIGKTNQKWPKNKKKTGEWEWLPWEYVGLTGKGLRSTFWSDSNILCVDGAFITQVYAFVKQMFTLDIPISVR